ncbi:LuxR C-terminal-related transcriptional regulator [Streptomyces sp. SID3343]|uniref:helix-turn-helix transcriptional regulator n=1 Tax=Streptomyces sp. SID3343 TaxID=2690260 RepID=UPI0013700553|nr:LuxR C-terminal-related transcriptional regulator [Streptomyces sp. SID3343]MYV98488.1 LuxR family transcriptional regulator [Streptomyces sp. SID3343]
MASRSAAAQQAIEGLRELAGEARSAPEVFRTADRLLRGVLEFDAVCWHTTDPATGWVTSVLSDDLSLDRFHDAVRLEVWHDDVTTFPQIRRSGLRADTLTRATRGRPETSMRFREQIAPAGFGDEMRTVFDTQGGMWGCAAFMRAPDRGPYLGRQRDLADAAARHIGVALRACHTAAAWSDPTDQAPATVVLGPSNTLVAADERARKLLAELVDDAHTALSVPTAFTLASEHARRAACGIPVSQAMVRVRNRDGRWFVLHASLLDGLADGHVAVVASPASPAQTMPLYLAAHGLTCREQEVALYAIRGYDTKEIARVLAMTPYTVQDHLKAVFGKAGVTSRRELIAQVVLGGHPAP